MFFIYKNVGTFTGNCISTLLYYSGQELIVNMSSALKIYNTKIFLFTQQTN
jgi:hypothetical protein